MLAAAMVAMCAYAEPTVTDVTADKNFAGSVPTGFHAKYAKFAKQSPKRNFAHFANLA